MKDFTSKQIPEKKCVWAEGKADYFPLMFVYKVLITAFTKGIYNHQSFVTKLFLEEMLPNAHKAKQPSHGGIALLLQLQFSFREVKGHIK